MVNENAYVGSSDAIADFRAALLTFQEEAQSAVESAETKAGQTLRFLDEDAPGYWDAQTRSAYDEVNAARIALSVCRNKTVAGRKSSCIEEKKAFAKAQDRLEVCQRKRSVARKTSIDAHDAAAEFRARIAHLHRILDAEVPKLQNLLHRTAVSLEAYTATRPSSAASVRAKNMEANALGGSATESNTDNAKPEADEPKTKAASEDSTQTDSNDRETN